MGTANVGSGVALGPAVVVGNGVRFAAGGVEMFTRVAKGESDVGVADGVGGTVGWAVDSFVARLVAELVGNAVAVDVSRMPESVLLATMVAAVVG